ncbi:hypothetical protein, partial [Enterobacter chengduensis]|uniref:hypothetical protein n=1 Tax=Enterobacter chengduensis TaxID=2494701 RepID=UPI002075A253
PCPWFDSESGHHYLKNPAYGWVFAFLRLSKPSLFLYFFISFPACFARWRCAYRAYGFSRTDKAKPPSGMIL